MLHPCLGLLARHGVPRSYLRGAESLWLTAYGAKRHGRSVGGRDVAAPRSVCLCSFFGQCRHALRGASCEVVMATHVAMLHTWLTKESPLCGGDAAPLPRAFGTARSAALLSPRSGVSMANRLWSEATWAECRWERCGCTAERVPLLLLRSV